MAFTLLDLLQGVTPTFDAQAIPDSTDWSILNAAHGNLGVPSSNNFGGTALTVAPCTATVTGPGSTTALSGLTGSTNLTGLTGIANGPLPVGGGYFLAPTTGGGNALIGFATSNGTTTLNSCFYISGGSGSISASATLTIVNAVTIPANVYFMSSPGGPTLFNSGTALSISIKNIGGTAFQAAPQSTTDRKDLLSLNITFTATITQGTPCGTLDWTRNNGSYTTPPPAKPAYSIVNTTVPLCEIYVPGLASTALAQNTAALTAGQLTDKTVQIAIPQLPSIRELLGSDFTIVNAATEVVAFTTGSIPIGTYLVSGQVQLVSTSASIDNVSIRMQPTASGGITAGANTQYPAAGGSIAATSFITLPFNGIVQVTAAGTLDLRVQASLGGSVTKVKALDFITGNADVTSFVLTRIN